MLGFVRLLAVLLLFAVSARAAGAAGGATGPPRFSPTGVAEDVREVTARFPERMVPLGDPRALESPFEIDCPATGTPRWVDSRTWAFDFPDVLPGGIECRFTLRDGLRTLDGRAVRGGASFSFSTGGPRIVSSDPDGENPITEDAAFVLRLTAEAALGTVEEHAYFGVEGIGERIGVRILAGSEREEILATLPEVTPTAPLVILQARRTFPPAAHVRLVWGKGIETTTGVALDADQILSFRVRKAFHATLHCTRERAGGPCVPLADVRLQFSEPVPWSSARAVALVDPEGDFRAEALPWHANDGLASGVLFDVDLPPGASLELRLPPDLRDEAGRPLENASQFPLRFETGPLPPLAKFAARFGILEATADPALPVTVRGLGPELDARALKATDGANGRLVRVDTPERVLPWLRRVRGVRRDESVFGKGSPEPGAATERLALPLPAEADVTEVLGIPLGDPGLYVVEIESAPLGRALLGAPRPMFVSAAALVTNLAVHLKHGVERSLVWVTTLDGAEPARGAEIDAYDCTGTLLASGVTDDRGLARLDALPAPDDLPTCSVEQKSGDDPWRGWRGETAALDGIDRGVFVTARLGRDLSFVFSSWDDGIEPWRFGIFGMGWGVPAGLHTIFDRTLLRAGDTVHMKHVVRLQTASGFAIPPPETLPSIASIRHVGSDTKIELPIVWAPDGSALTTWDIPPSAKLGEYEVHLEPRPRSEPSDATATEGADGPVTVHRPAAPEIRGRSGSFRVEEFRVPLMHAVLKLPAEAQIAPAAVPVDIALRYLAGGGAGDSTVRLRSQLAPHAVEAPREFEGLVFGNGPVAVGIERRSTSGPEEPPHPEVHQREDVQLDAEGTARAWITDLPPPKRPERLTAEVEYRDPTGETQTATTSIALWPSRYAVGLRVDDWVGSTGRIVVETAVIDAAGAPVEGAEVEVKAFARRNYTSRKRVVGGFYAYESVEETTFAHTLCHGTTDAAGRFTCRRTPPETGELVVQATTVDGDGRASASHQSVWISGDDDAWFRPSDTDRMELVPERRRYEPGETARVQVRMPFPRALALITVEREGVLEAWVQELEGVDPVVEIAVGEHFAPNAYLSVLAVRGRVTTPAPTGRLDLGKPAYRLGLTEIDVGWRAHELAVDVTTDRPVYRVREKARVSIAVRDAAGGAPPPGSDVAIAAVDEGLLELVPNTSWRLLAAMMGERPERVRTSTAQMQVVGKRHFGRKARAEGGGGGRRPTRELFDTLLLWNGRVPLDGDGRAEIDVPLNDSLTSFRIVAVATGGAGHFGDGKTSIRTTQDLMIFSGLPPVVRNGDTLWSEFTVRNTAERKVDLQVTALVDGLGAELSPLDVRLAAGEARAVGWQTTVPADVDRLEWEIQARDTRGDGTDRLRVAQSVKPAIPVRTMQASLVQWEGPGPSRQPVALPAGAVEGRGGISVTLAGSLADGLEGVRSWMRDYPYTCLEQRVSRAVALGDDAAWASVVQALPSYADENGLLKFFPTMTRGSPVLTAYVLEISELAGRRMPADLQGRMQTALERFVEGKLASTGATRAGARSLEKLAALAALASVGRARADLVSSLAVEPEVWPTTSVLDWWNVLLGLPDLPSRAKRLADVERVLRARLVEQGSTLTLAPDGTSSGWWLLANGDTDALRLVLVLLRADAWREDLPRIVRGAIGLQRDGSWSTTVANAWGTLAITRFAEAFEPEPVGGSTVAAVAGYAQQVDWVRHPHGATLHFPWPPGPAELTVQHQGTGRPWILTRARAAVPLTEPFGSGFRIRRTATPVEPRADGRLQVGDVVHVELEVESVGDQGWVVVEDPIPSGASFLGRGFATDSTLSPDDAGDAMPPAFVERGFESYRAYYERVPPGTFTLEYRIRLNQSGTFHPPPSHVEALYSPEAFAELPQPPTRVDR